MLKKWFSIKNTALQFTSAMPSNDVNLKDLQATLLEMYEDVIQFCDQHQLDIFAVGGTSLGAIRHNGFIPWDDDIDLGMLRSDYSKFIALFENSALSEKYILKAPNYSQNNPNRFVQLYHKNTILKTIHNGSNPEWQMVFLDIFPYDSVSNNKFIRTIKGITSDALMLIASCVGIVEKNDPTTKEMFYSSQQGKINYQIRSLIGKIFSFKSHSEWFDIIDNFVKNDDPNSQFITSAMGSKHYLGEIISRNIILPLRTQPFDKLSVKVFHKVEDYLTMLYGNTYMQIPEKKYTHSVVYFEKIKTK